MDEHGNKIRLHWRRESIIDVYQLVFGFFLFLSPWLFAYARSTSKIETWVISLAIMVTSAAALMAFASWEEWLNLLFGAWLVVAPWVLGFAHTTAMHVSITVGLVIAYLALLELWLVHYPSNGGSDAGMTAAR